MLRRILLCTLFAAASASAMAGSDSGKAAMPPEVIQDPLSKGMTEVEVLGGYFHSTFNTGGASRPEFDYAGADVRYGVVLSPILFRDSPVMRGDIEILGDGFGQGVTKGPGNFLAGGSVLFRYNFFHPGSRFIPYFQLGGGGLHTDAAEVPVQKIIGGNFEFLLQADFGARFMLNDRWSLLLEAGFQHISNADTASRNVGVDSIGGRLGAGYLY